MTKRELLNITQKEVDNIIPQAENTYLKTRLATECDVYVNSQQSGYGNYKIEIGDTLYYMSMPNSCADAMDMLNNYFGLFHCGQEKMVFISTYGGYTINSIKAELRIINNEISFSDNLDFREACIYSD